MMVEWAVAIVLTGVGGLLVEGARRARRSRGSGPDTASEAEERSSAAGLRVGDVLLWEDRELWLAGELYLEDAGLELHLFRAPDVGAERWVAWSSAHPADVAILEPSERIPSGEVPISLPHGGREHRLSRRGRAELHRRGEELPAGLEGPLGYALLDSAADGGTLIILNGERGSRLALAGRRVGLDRLDRLPSRT